MYKTGFGFVLFSILYFDYFGTFDQNIRIREALVIVYIVGLLALMKATKEKLVITPDSWVLITFVPYLFVSTVIAVVNFKDQTVMRFLLFSLENILLYILLRSWFFSNKDHSRVIKSIATAWFVFVISIVVISYFFGSADRLGGPNGVALYTVSLAAPLISNSISMKRYDHFLFIFSISLALAYFQSARAAIIILMLVSALNFGLNVRREHFKRVLQFFLGLGSLICFWFLITTIFWRGIDFAPVDFSKRDELISQSIRFFSETNFIGFGLGSTKHVILAMNHFPHNAFLFIALELGAVGLILFLVFLILNLASIRLAGLSPFGIHGKTYLSFLLTLILTLLVSHWTFQVLHFFTPMLFLLAILTPAKGCRRI